MKTNKNNVYGYAAVRNSIRGDAEYYDKLEELAARGVPVYV